MLYKQHMTTCLYRTMRRVPRMADLVDIKPGTHYPCSRPINTGSVNRRFFVGKSIVVLLHHRTEGRPQVRRGHSRMRQGCFFSTRPRVSKTATMNTPPQHGCHFGRPCSRPVFKVDVFDTREHGCLKMTPVFTIPVFTGGEHG